MVWDVEAVLRQFESVFHLQFWVSAFQISEFVSFASSIELYTIGGGGPISRGQFLLLFLMARMKTVYRSQLKTSNSSPNTMGQSVRAIICSSSNTLALVTPYRKVTISYVSSDASK